MWQFHWAVQVFEYLLYFKKSCFWREQHKRKNGSWLLKAWQPKPEGLQMEQKTGISSYSEKCYLWTYEKLDSHPSFLRDALSSWIALFILLWLLLSWRWKLKEIWIISLHKNSRCPPLVSDDWQCNVEQEPFSSIASMVWNVSKYLLICLFCARYFQFLATFFQIGVSFL